MAEPWKTVMGWDPGSAEGAVCFTLDIRPHGKEAVKARAIRSGNKWIAQTYTPTKTRNRMKEIAELAQPFRPADVLDGPLDAYVVAEFPRPEYMCKRSKRTGKLLGGYSEGRVFHTAKPDCDNISKLVLDSLKAFWGDDAQVCRLVVDKYYHAIGGAPSVGVVIEKTTREP